MTKDKVVETTKDKAETLYQKLAKDFPAKAYRNVNIGRGFTTIDAYFIINRLNTLFGLCGEGWGVKDISFEISEDKKSVAAVGSMWYINPQTKQRAEVLAVGDAMVIKGNVAEGMKKAQTNLISKASSFMGVGLRVYMGLHADDPYLDRQAS